MSKFHRHFFFGTFFLFLLSIALFTALIMIVSLNLSGTFSYWVVGLSLAVPVFFIFTSILYRHFDSFFSRVLYVMSSYIGGVFIYWFFASLILTVIFVLSLFQNIQNLFPISLFLYSFATFLAIFGFYQAKEIKIVRYNVPAPKRHLSLIGKKFVLISDTHFGPINQEKFARRIFKKIIEINPSAVLFPGDMFDSEYYGDVENIKKEILNLTSKFPVYFSPGNHEQYGPFNYFMEIASDAGMIVLIDQTVNFSGVPIFGMNFKQKKNMDEISKLIKDSISAENPAIVLNHDPVFHDLLSEAGAFLMVSGHTHNGQFWPGNFLTRLAYKKYNYGLRKFNGLTVITSSGIGTFGPPMRTFNKPEIVVINFV